MHWYEICVPCFQLSAKSLHRGFLDQQSCHLVSPSILLTDRISAEYFPEPSDSSDADHYQLYGQVQTNMAVLHYDTIMSLLAYANDLQRTRSTDEYERQVCYCLAQIFSAVLDSYSSGTSSLYAIKSLAMRDIAVVTVRGSDEKYLVVNAASQNHRQHVDYEMLYADMHAIINQLLGGEPAAQSRYGHGLQCFVRMLSDCRFESLIRSKTIVDYLLWGPCSEDHAVLMANDGQQAFGVWLEVARCKAVSDFALGQLPHSVYTANRLQFLCCVTPSSLSETALLLSE